MNRNLVGIAAIILVAAVAYFVLTMPDHRSATDKIGDAVHELPNGPGHAARELEDRTPGQRIGDAVKDNTKSQ